jgi:predicted ATPase
LVYQHGVLPQATYLFKHALVQDTAYQSLLRSTRQQYHQRIAQVLTEYFPATVEAQPELLAHHYTEAGLSQHAVTYWQRAGQRALERSAHIEAIAHLTQGLALLQALPDSPERAQHELHVQTTLGPALMALKGWGAPEVEVAYTRARALCQQVGETPQLFPVLWGLWRIYSERAEHQTSREIGEQLLSLARRLKDGALLLQAHHALWPTLFYLGHLVPAHTHAGQGMALYNPQQHHAHAFVYGGHDPGVCCQQVDAVNLWFLGYADQSRARAEMALVLAREMAHPMSLTQALYWTAWLYQLRREEHVAQERLEEMLALSTTQEFTLTLARGIILQGRILAAQGQTAAGITQMQRGLAAQQATGAVALRSYFLALLAEGYGQEGQAEAGLHVLAEALTVVSQHAEHFYEAELHRQQGELLLRQAVPDASQAETCFQQALAIARQQEAKSLELRAAMSLSHLWQQQGKRVEARQLLAGVYGWFTEGFDTADLQEAGALLEMLGA